MLNQNNMQKSKHLVPVLLGLLIMVIMIGMSYYNQSIFLDRILLCSFIIGVVLLAKVRSGVQRVIPEEKDK
jgi:hypothetical protein